MSRQEEIREGLGKLYRDGRLTPVNALFFLEKQGVVIKVNKEMPAYYQFGIYDAHPALEELGLSILAVEPLVKEGQ